MTSPKTANVWLGSETGLLKAVNLVKKLATNHFDQTKYGREEEILCMCWENDKKSKLYTGHKSGTVREFSLDSGQFGDPVQIPDYDLKMEQLVGTFKKEKSIVTCTTSGKVRVFSSPHDVQTSINVGLNVHVMKVDENQGNRFATGGKEHSLTLWNFNNPKEPTFRAKNVSHDWLQLRVPVWVTGIEFLKDSEKIITCTGTSKIRVYDPSSQRRPVLEIGFDEYPITAITLTRNPHEVIVGNTRGNVALFDVRKKSMVHALKGFAGSVRNLACHSTLPYVASCGPDRFLRIHDINTRNLEHKVYLKSRLNCLLLSDLDFVSDTKKEELEQTRVEERKRLQNETNDELSDEEDEELWKKMEKVDDNCKNNDIETKRSKVKKRRFKKQSS